ncbi:MAG: hypothetical protein GX614_04100 [Sandaracinaceae bacterium]|nr:hypothetical protein [Sandaracinaceae bacterium]
MIERHPCTTSWRFPEVSRLENPDLPGGIRRTNLRELTARPGRYEHHLMVVASIGPNQLEAPTASEPLYFAHQNFSDEWVVTLPTGNPMLDSFEPRIFIQDKESFGDESRFLQRTLELVLHPYGHLHWPSRLRPPYAPPPIPPGLRQCGLTLVYCANVDTPPDERRPLRIGSGLAVRGKGDTSVPRTHLDLRSEDEGIVARVGESSLRLLVSPETINAPRGAYLAILEGEGAHFETDLIYLPKGSSLSGEGIKRALLFASDNLDADPPPPSWTAVPEPPFAPFEKAAPGELPLRMAGIEVEPIDAAFVRIRIGASDSEIPRHWAARHLFRWPLHRYRLAYLETYGGLYTDDRGEDAIIGLRGGDSVSIHKDELTPIVEALYRAIAPPGYTEELLP